MTIKNLFQIYHYFIRCTLASKLCAKSLCIHLRGPYIVFLQINPHYMYVLSIKFCLLKKFWHYIYSNWTSITQYFFAACCNELRDIIKLGIAYMYVIWPALIGVRLTVQQLCEWPRLIAGNQGQKPYEYWWDKVLQKLSVIDINLNFN